MRGEIYLNDKLKSFVQAKGWQWPEKATLEPPKDEKFGDLASNLAMMLTRQAKTAPRKIAEEIRETLLAQCPEVETIEIAGPGFLNFFFNRAFWLATIPEIASQKESYGTSRQGKTTKVQIEYVSANPTGPLHIGHGRGAAIGDSLTRILRATGHEVHTEYYLNDAGRQMLLLGNSVWVRLRQLAGEDIEFPEESYKGDYIKTIAADILAAKGKAFLDTPEDQAIEYCKNVAVEVILDGIKKDLAHFRVEHQNWFSEKSLVDKGVVTKTLETLKAKGLAYDKDGALWFESTRFGDDKDRVLRKSNGYLTYFASDIAYHANKIERGFDLMVDIWGADHHGYVPRMKAGIEAVGNDRESLQVILVQLVNLLRGGEQIAMSTRAGKFETLADVCEEVGVDAARFIFLSRKSDSHLDFDLDVVKKQSMDNPVYYVQYAHARICSLMAKAKERGIQGTHPDMELLALLDTPEDLALAKRMDRFPDILSLAARTLSPHHVSYYLQELAGDLHRYYNVHHILNAPNPQLLQARLHLFKAVAQVLRNGLALLGVDAPEKM
ncbi:arginine--tRNA ligase [Desulfoplanes formicivorans]|uniref:Arginine--tRNA ligase n=1 Tax=Desulfoplanes formicivorans TaxID=1592317 RepID=A0A194AET3_9BACT|nr:arginine--tRNA ligase [Desulfoplanes formicivorans]GAU07700.1 arginyl-tRNA synthetase [Desulfoplanes formicivorans]